MLYDQEKVLASNKERITVLDGFRGYAILLVFFVHFYALHYKADYFPDSGAPLFLLRLLSSHLGVDLFFVISGFLIYIFYFHKDITVTEFYSKRISRLMPAYLTAVIVYFEYLVLKVELPYILITTIVLTLAMRTLSRYGLLEHLLRYVMWFQIIGLVAISVAGSRLIGSDLSLVSHASQLVTNILFLQYFFDDIRSVIHVSWSLVTELVFYAFFIIWKKLYDHVDIKPGAYLSIFLVLIVVAFLIAVQFYIKDMGSISKIHLNRAPAFVVGMIAGWLFVNRDSEGRGRLFRCAVAVEIVFLVAVIIVQNIWIPLLECCNTFSVKSGFFLVAASLFGVLIMCAVECKGVISRIFNISLLRKLGEVSYSFYLFHVLVIIITAKLIKASSLGDMVVHFIVSFVVTVFVSYMSFRYIELLHFRSGR